MFETNGTIDYKGPYWNYTDRTRPYEKTKNYNPVYEAYRILLSIKDPEDPAIEEAIGYLGEALAE